MVRAVLKVHSERSVHMTQVVMVIQLSKGLVGQLRLSMEASEHVITWDTVRTELRDNISGKTFGQCANDSYSHHTQPFLNLYSHGLTFEKVGYPVLIFCSCIHLHAFAAVKHIIMVRLIGSWMIRSMAMIVVMVTGLTGQKLSQNIWV